MPNPALIDRARIVLTISARKPNLIFPLHTVWLFDDIQSRSDLRCADAFNLRPQANASDAVADVATINDVRDVGQPADLDAANKGTQRFLVALLHFRTGESD